MAAGHGQVEQVGPLPGIYAALVLPGGFERICWGQFELFPDLGKGNGAFYDPVVCLDLTFFRDVGQRMGLVVEQCRVVPVVAIGDIQGIFPDLEKRLYPLLGITHDMILNDDHFNYYPESELDIMKEQVDSGQYDIAVALHPVSIDELMAIADAGLEDPDIVMPEKSTFFSPKILSGLVLYRHQTKKETIAG